MTKFSEILTLFAVMVSSRALWLSTSSYSNCNNREGALISEYSELKSI